MSDSETVQRAHWIAERMADTGAIGEEQAKAYVFRDVFEFGRAETAELLDKNPNTLDNLRVSGAQRVAQARKLIDVFETEDDLIQARRSGTKLWHRDPSDPAACRHAGSVKPRQSYEYRVVPESAVATLGDLCSDCFEK